MIVCWLTLQILAASPVVNTVFVLDIRESSFLNVRYQLDERVAKLARSVYPLRLAAPAEFAEPAVAGAENIQRTEIRSRWISKRVTLVNLLLYAAQDFRDK
jgi:hypothetical protein